MEKVVSLHASEDLEPTLGHCSRVISGLNKASSTKLAENLLTTLREFYCLTRQDKTNFLPLPVELVDADEIAEIDWAEVKTLNWDASCPTVRF